MSDQEIVKRLRETIDFLKVEYLLAVCGIRHN